MRKLDASNLARAATMLPLNLLQALLTRQIPLDPLFDGSDFRDPLLGSPPRLIICNGGFSAHATLAGFVHWASLFFDGPLALKHFHDISHWKAEKICPPESECDNTN